MTAMPTDALTCPRCGTPARPHCTDRACGWAFCAGCAPGPRHVEQRPRAAERRSHLRHEHPKGLEMTATPTAYQRTAYLDLVDGLVEPACRYAQNAVVSPEAGSEQAWRTAAAALDGIDAVIKAGHMSSSPIYAERDLRMDTPEKLKQLRHYVQILGKLYGPQVAPHA